MTIDYDSFSRASTAIHLAQGAALFVLGAAEAYSHDNPGSRAVLAGPLALLAAALAIPLIMLGVAGNWNMDQLRAALDIRRGFYLFIAFACLFGAAGMSRLTQAVIKKAGGGWQAAFLFFLAGAGVLYFLLAWRVNEEAWHQVFAWHSAMGATLLLAVAAKAAHVFSGRRLLHAAWGVLLLVTAVQLMSYRETPAAFGLRMVTFQTSPDLPAPQTK